MPLNNNKTDHNPSPKVLALATPVSKIWLGGWELLKKSPPPPWLAANHHHSLSLATLSTKTEESTFALASRLAGVAEKAWQVGLELATDELLCCRKLRHGGQKQCMLLVDSHT